LSLGFSGTVALGQFSFSKNNIKLLFWNKILSLFDISAYWVKLSSKCDLDSAGCIVHYDINAVLKQTSYFEHCLGGPSIRVLVRPARAQVWGGLWKLQAGPAGPSPSCRYRPACYMDPPAAVAAVGAISDHAYPGFYN
jgi:hypothetical protein